MATVYVIGAVSTPPIITYSDVINPASLISNTSQKLAQADVGQVRTKFNTNAVALDLAGRYGGGAYALGYGLGLSISSGLTLAIAAGNFICDGYQYYAGGTQALSNNTYSWLWLTKTGTIEVQTGATQTPVPNPSVNARVYLGRVLTAAGAITEIEGSGVLYLRGGICYRRTGDTLSPGDSPTINLLIVTRTVGGTYLWDGNSHKKFVNVGEISDVNFDFSVWGRHFLMGNR